MSLHEKAARFPLKLMFLWGYMGGMHAGKVKEGLSNPKGFGLVMVVI